jgi:hypothetical protein
MLELHIGPMLWATAAIVFAINIPFGYWRANTRRFNWQWILAIHLPVAAMVGLRFGFDLGWGWETYVVLVSTFVGSQYLGGWLHGWWQRSFPTPATSCLIMDIGRRLHAQPKHS